MNKSGFYYKKPISNCMDREASIYKTPTYQTFLLSRYPSATLGQLVGSLLYKKQYPTCEYKNETQMNANYHLNKIL